MAKKIGPSVNRSLQNSAKLRQQRNVAQQNRELAHKAELKDVKGDTAVSLGRQNQKTKEDKELSKGPQEKVSLSAQENAKSQPAESSAESLKQSDVKAGAAEAGAKAENAQAPKQKTVQDHASDFLNTFAATADKGDMQAISQKASQSMQRLAQSGGKVDESAVLAAETYNHAKAAISKKMPNASQKEIREAAKNDPELAKNVKLLDATTNYLTSLKKSSNQGGASAAQGAGEGGAKASAAGGNGAPLGANPFDAGGQPPGGQGPGGPQQPGGEDPFYHHSPVEQAQMMQEQQSNMQEIMKIYNEMMAERRKTMAQIHAMNMTTNQEIMEIYKNIFLRQRQIADANHNKYVAMISEAG